MKNVDFGRLRIEQEDSQAFERALQDYGYVDETGSIDGHLTNLYSALYTLPLYNALKRNKSKWDKANDFINNRQENSDYQEKYLFLCGLYDEIKSSIPHPLLNLGANEDLFMTLWYEFAADWEDIRLDD